MRQFTKSLGSFSWAMSLFGLKQLADMMTPQDPAGTSEAGAGPAALDAMAQAAHEHLGDGYKEAFKSGDQMFRAMVDMMLGGGCADCPPAWPGAGPQQPGPRPRPDGR